MKKRTKIFYAIDLAVFVILGAVLFFVGNVGPGKSVLNLVLNNLIFWLTFFVLTKIKKSKILLGNFLSGLVYIGIGLFMGFATVLLVLLNICGGAFDFDILYALLFVAPLVLGAGAVKEKIQKIDDPLDESPETSDRDSEKLLGGLFGWNMFRPVQSDSSEVLSKDSGSEEECDS